MKGSIRYFTGKRAPGFKWLIGVGFQCPGHGDYALGRVERHLRVEEGVIKAGGGGLTMRGGVENTVQASPEDRAEAHGAGFATGVDFAALQVVGLKRGGGTADGGNFGVGGGVATGGDQVHTFGDEFPSPSDHSAKGPAAAGLDIFDG